jgi:hypothetical protein
MKAIPPPYWGLIEVPTSLTLARLGLWANKFRPRAYSHFINILEDTEYVKINQSPSTKGVGTVQSGIQSVADSNTWRKNFSIVK